VEVNDDLVDYYIFSMKAYSGIESSLKDITFKMKMPCIKDKLFLTK